MNKWELIKRACENGIWAEVVESYKDIRLKKCYVNQFVNATAFTKEQLVVYTGIEYCFNWREDIVVTEEKYIKKPFSYPLASKTYAINYDSSMYYPIDEYKKTWWLKQDKSE